MATLEWSIPFTIVSPYGSLDLNAPDAEGRVFRINPQKSVGRRSIRAETSDIPQGDGEIFHERYARGYEMQLAVQLWQGETQIACDIALCEMRDQLYGVLWSLLRPADESGRLIWTPSCPGDRMIDRCRLLSLSDPEEGDEGASEITFILDTPFPYAMATAQSVINVSGAGAITNNGNVEFWPVIKVNGSAGIFVIENLTTGFEIHWDATYGGTSIGVGEYAEIDTFKGTIFLNGDDDDLSNSLEATTSDFFPLVPGVNDIFTTFADADFLVNDAFA